MGDVSTMFLPMPTLSSTTGKEKSAFDDLNAFCTRSNTLALCAYVQGFYGLAFDISRDQIQFLSTLNSCYARICEIQARINLIRLNRAVIKPEQLKLETDLLLQSLAFCQQMDLSVVPIAEAKALDDGTMWTMAENTMIIESAKLAWSLGDLECCYQISSQLAINSATAMECSVRCLLEMGRIAEVIEMAFRNAVQFHWLKAYAAIAFLRGGALSEARRVLAASTDVHFLPMIRVAAELSRQGLSEECNKLMEKLLEHQLASRQEAPALIAASFCHAHGVAIPESMSMQISEIFSSSRHFPAVLLYEFVINGRDHCCLSRLQNGLIHSASIRFLSDDNSAAEVRHVAQPAVEVALYDRIRAAHTSTQNAAVDLLTGVRSKQLLVV